MSEHLLHYVRVTGIGATFPYPNPISARNITSLPSTDEHGKARKISQMSVTPISRFPTKTN